MVWFFGTPWASLCQSVFQTESIFPAQNLHFISSSSLRLVYITKLALAVSFVNRAMPTFPTQQHGLMGYLWSLTCRTSCRGTLPPDQPCLCCLLKCWSCVRCCHNGLWCWEGSGEGGGWPGTMAALGRHPHCLSWSGQSRAANTIKVRNTGTMKATKMFNAVAENDWNL